jgi:predicted metalloprotease with PDZ domain
MTLENDLIYRVRLDGPSAHLFALELEIPVQPGGERILSLPAWTPGSYMIRDRATDVSSGYAATSTSTSGMSSASVPRSSWIRT